MQSEVEKVPFDERPGKYKGFKRKYPFQPTVCVPPASLAIENCVVTWISYDS